MSDRGEAAVIDVKALKSESCAEMTIAIDRKPTEITEIGLWTPSRKGKLITVQQWRVLDGNLKFCYNGRVMYGPGNWYWWLFVIGHLIVTTLVFLWFDVWSVFPSILSYGITTGTLFLLGLAVFSSLQIVFTDPGYVLRPDVEDRVENLVNYHADKKPDLTMTKTLSVNGKTQICTFCEICCVYRPQRAQHCEICDCCIERYDRHCNTFGVCIGLRNVGAYIRFLFFALCTFQVIQSVALKNMIDSMGEFGWNGILCSPTLYVLLASCFHPPYGIVNFSWILLTLLFNLMLDRTHYEAKNRLNCSECSGTGWRVRTHVFWVNFCALVLTSPPKSNIEPRSYVKTKAVRRLSQQEVDDVSRRQQRSFLSYSMARGEVPVTTAEPIPRNKFLSSIRRFFRLDPRRRQHLQRPRSLIYFPRRTRRVMDYPGNSRPVIYGIRRPQQPNNSQTLNET